jgi:hypothetical protein
VVWFCGRESRLVEQGGHVYRHRGLTVVDDDDDDDNSLVVWRFGAWFCR